jgi:hypothetical protein
MTPAQPIIRFDASGERRACSLPALLADIALARAGRSLPFTPERVRVVVRFADSLAGEPAFRDVRALQAFAFWIRRSAITRLQSDFAARLPANSIAVGRGTAFHLPPAKIDTIFLYSWVVAFLAGNVNVTRLPSVLDGAIEHALGLLLDLLRDSGFDDAFLFYPTSDEINRAISHIADLRFVWAATSKSRRSRPCRCAAEGDPLRFRIATRTR